MSTEVPGIIIWAPVISAGAAAISALFVIVAAIIAIKTFRRAGMALSVDLLLKLEQQYNSDAFCLKRKAAASFLLADATGKEGSTDVDDILNFFEMLGLLIKEKALNPKVVWHCFFDDINGYCQGAKTYVESVCCEDSVTWADLQDVRETILHVERQERKKRGRGYSDHDVLLSDEDAQRFLRDEARSAERSTD
jgi:hypothetical protein